MSLEKMRTLLALLLKKISTPGRLKKLGFGSRLIGNSFSFAWQDYGCIIIKDVKWYNA